MIIIRDLYTQVEYSSIESSGTELGQTIIQYEVKEYVDTRNITETKAYIVTCTQRLVLPNPSPYTPNAASTTSFLNYPALLTNSIAISDPNSIIQAQILLSYTPRTLNTSVNSNQSSGQSSDLAVSHQYTSGSSTATTNSFGVTLSVDRSVGFWGPMLTGGVSIGTSGNYEHSKTTETSSSHSEGNSVDHGSQLSNSDSMTIKDWGSYASIDVNNTCPTWVWGQEYPWNVIQLKNTDTNGNVVLPAYVIQRLYDGTQVYPPSELALFGVDFVCKASWLITPKPGDAKAEEITFTHTLTYGAASHSVTGGALTANLDTYQPAITYTSNPLDLAVLALDPIRSTDRSAAIVGFVLNQFDVPPTSTGSPFSITADSNNLLVRGSGFTGVMATDFSAGIAQMEIYFKVVDSTSDIIISLKHWVTDSAACQLTIVANGNSDATITKFVDAPEAGSGGDNVMVIALRKKDFISVDYCNYLRMGLNTISITFSPVNSSVTTTYNLLAMAVG